MSERFENLADIKKRKYAITKHDPPVNQLSEDITYILEDASDYAGDSADVVMESIGESLKAGETDIEFLVKEALIGVLPPSKAEQPIKDIAMSLRLNAMRPVEYFEAKPTRAVSFDDFAGAIVQPNTSKEVIDILKNRGLKVVKQTKKDYEKFDGKVNARQKFPKEMFALAPVGVASLMQEEPKTSN
jgi:hypothetical protein